jgi:hypothetical protein
VGRGYHPRVTTADGQPGLLPAPEHEQRFWALLESAWSRLGPEANQARRALVTRAPGSDPDLTTIDRSLDTMLAGLTDDCAGFSGDELIDLDRVVERKLYDIDREDVQAVTDGSDDGFLYARGFIVALGRDFYQAVARDPEMAVMDAECEDMCYFFAHLHHARFGDFPRTGSGISRESCSNPAGWPG